ncbi:MAG: hypothetical protein GW917_00605 [Bdellovibrionales bacterium]|nr:hypothetical protein [Bdellovibrionales bacterium]
MKSLMLVQKSILVSVFGLSFNIYAQSTTESQLRKSLPEVRAVEVREEFEPHIAALVGVSNPEGSFDTGAEYGVDVGFQPVIPFGAGMEVSQAIYNANAGDDFKRTSFLLKGTYNFGGNLMILRDSYVGLATGLLVEDIGPTTNTYGGLMPNLGFDIKTFKVDQDWVSLGANARYLMTASDSPDVFAINGVMKYWF